MKTLVAFIFAVLISTSAFAEGNAPPAKALPKDASDFISRANECTHWAGEDPYDKAREEQIEKAVKALNCDSIDKDEAVLRAKYAHDSAVTTALDAVATSN